MLRSSLIIAALVGIASDSSGQDLQGLFEPRGDTWISADENGEVADHLETDRDSFTPATSTVGAGRILFESAYSFVENRDTDDSHSFPEILTRIGVTDRLELRLGWNYEVGGGSEISSSGSGGAIENLGAGEESQTLYGLKYSLTRQQAWLPQSACIVQATTPTYGPETATDLQLGYVAGWTFFDDWVLDSSIRYVHTTEEGDRHNLWAPSVVLKIPVEKRWNVHGEYFGIFTAGREVERNPQYFSPGVHYSISPDCELGVRVGWGLNPDAANFFSNVGLGLRF